MRRRARGGHELPSHLIRDDCLSTAEDAPRQGQHQAIEGQVDLRMHNWSQKDPDDPDVHGCFPWAGAQRTSPAQTIIAPIMMGTSDTHVRVEYFFLKKTQLATAVRPGIVHRTICTKGTLACANEALPTTIFATKRKLIAA